MNNCWLACFASEPANELICRRAGSGRGPAHRPGAQNILQFLLKSFYCSQFSWFFVTENLTADKLPEKHLFSRLIHRFSLLSRLLPARFIG
jgi:hypothetical protein